MKLKNNRSILVYLLIICCIFSCATSPTGRSQLHLIPAEQMDQMGIAAYEDLKKRHRNQVINL